MTRRASFSRQVQDLYLLPIVISDGGSPALSSTNTLTIRVCGCDGDRISCNAEAYTLNAGLSTGALIAILACIVILLGKETSAFCLSFDFHDFEFHDFPFSMDWSTGSTI